MPVSATPADAAPAMPATDYEKQSLLGEGTFDIHRVREGETTPELVQQRAAGDIFGELALMGDAKRSATAEYHQLKAEMERLEETFETSSVGMKKEKEMMEKLKRMGNRVGELAPEVEEFELVKVDLKDLTLEDRERVLRLLFAKINAVQGTVPQMPPHELEQGTTPFMTQLPPQLRVAAWKSELVHDRELEKNRARLRASSLGRAAGQGSVREYL